MSTCKTISQVIKEIDYWLRLATFLNGPLKQQLLCVLHNKNNNARYHGLPEDPADLYTSLSTTHKTTLDKLKKNIILKKDQLELLLPANGNKTDSQAFDVTIIVVLIINCTTLPAPVNGWYKPPLDSDTSIGANVVRARAWRNFLSHADPSAFDQVAFNLEWNKAIAMLKGLGGSVTVDMTNLKTCSLDPNHAPVMKSLMDFHQWEVTTLKTEVAKHTKDLKDVQHALSQEQKKSRDTNKEIITILYKLQYLSEELEKMKKLESENDTGSLFHNYIIIMI